jgi:uncharacterized protein (DUF1800 family)
MPYAAAGLTDRQAAAHLLDRFTYGPAPGQIDRVVMEGLERWFARQLRATEYSDDLRDKLSRLESLRKTNREIVREYPRAGRVKRRAIEEGRIDPGADRDEQRRALAAYYDEMGYRRPGNIIREQIAARVFRAVHAAGQVEEVMVEFWFNHFYVSATDNQSARFIGTFERDVVRRHVFDRFEAMLTASSRHPAMLLYLDNALSTAPEGAYTTAAYNRDRWGIGAGVGRYNDTRKGINENYARELLELHTLGVDGGYNQNDVVAVARSLTGWTVVPEGQRGDRLIERLSEPVAYDLGFRIHDDFLFNAAGHDAGEKTVLGRVFHEGGGYDEGVEVLGLLAGHPSTARHIARKLAVRFVSDDPPGSVVDRLAECFLRTGGDLREMLFEIVYSPEFWAPEARRAKIKTPFELAASSVRIGGGEVRDPRRLIRWIDRMGQPLFRYQSPAGFPDRAEMWVNAGSLLHRMNYGITLASGRIKGVYFSPERLPDFRDQREPESAETALEVFAGFLLPERELEETLRALRPLVTRPDVAREIRSRAEQIDEPLPDSLRIDDGSDAARDGDGSPVTVSHIIGLIIGSPEFQRR